MTTTGSPTRPEVLDQARSLLREEFGDSGEQITEDTVILDLPGADSAKAIRVVAKMEQRYSVKLLDENVEPARTVGEFVDMVLAAQHD